MEVQHISDYWWTTSFLTFWCYQQHLVEHPVVFCLQYPWSQEGYFQCLFCWIRSKLKIGFRTVQSEDVMVFPGARKHLPQVLSGLKWPCLALSAPFLILSDFSPHHTWVEVRGSSRGFREEGIDLYVTMTFFDDLHLCAYETWFRTSLSLL